MEFPSKTEIEILRKTYPAGTKVMVDNMEDAHAIPSGSIGTVQHVDDIGQIHLQEYGLALIKGVDSFHKIKED